MEICKYCGHNELWKAGVAAGKREYQHSKRKSTMIMVDVREKYTEQERQMGGCEFYECKDL